MIRAYIERRSIAVDGVSTKRGWCLYLLPPFPPQNSTPILVGEALKERGFPARMRQRETGRDITRKGAPTQDKLGRKAGQRETNRDNTNPVTMTIRFNGPVDVLRLP